MQTIFDAKGLIAPPEFKNHWAPDVTEELYHADRTSIGSSQLRRAKDSLKEFFGIMSGEIVGQSSPETRFGKKVHMAILEPERFRNSYLIEPIFQGRNQKGELTTSANCLEVKQAKAEWYGRIPSDAVIVSNEEINIITGIAKSIQEYPDAMMLIEGASPETSGYYRDPETGLKMKVRIDLPIIGSLAIVTDLKTTRDCSNIKFGKSTFSDDLRYDIQLFQYMYGMKQISGRSQVAAHLLAVEKTPPYEVAVYYFEDADLWQAEQDYHDTTRKIRKAIDEGVWAQRQQMMERIYTPKYFQNDSVMQDELNENNLGVG